MGPWKQSGSADGHNWNYGGVVALDTVSQSEYVPNIDGMVDVFGGEFKADVGIWSPSSYKDSLPKLMRIGERLDELPEEPSDERSRLLLQRDGFAARAKVYEALSREGLVIDGQTLVVHLFDGDVASAQSQIESWKVNNEPVYNVAVPEVSLEGVFIAGAGHNNKQRHLRAWFRTGAANSTALHRSEPSSSDLYYISEQGGFGEIALEVIPDGLWVMWRHDHHGLQPLCSLERLAWTCWALTLHRSWFAS